MGRPKEEVSMCQIGDLVKYAYQRYEHVRAEFSYRYDTSNPKYLKYRNHLVEILKKHHVLDGTSVSEEIGKFIVDHTLKSYFNGNEEEDLEMLKEKSSLKDCILTEIKKDLEIIELTWKETEFGWAENVKEYVEKRKKEYQDKHKQKCPEEEERKYYAAYKKKVNDNFKRYYAEINMKCYVYVCTEEYLEEKAKKYSERCKKKCDTEFLKCPRQISVAKCLEICVDEYKKDYEKIYGEKCPEENRKKFIKECTEQCGTKKKELDDEDITCCVQVCLEQYKAEFQSEKSIKYSAQCMEKCKEEYGKSCSTKRCIEICAAEYKKEFEETYGEVDSENDIKAYSDRFKERCKGLIASYALFDEEKGIAQGFYTHHLPLKPEEDWTSELTDQIIDRLMLRSIFQLFYTFHEEEFRKDLHRRAECIPFESFADFLPGYSELTDKLENPFEQYVFMNKNMKTLEKNIQKLSRDIKKLNEDIQNLNKKKDTKRTIKKPDKNVTKS